MYWREIGPTSLANGKYRRTNHLPRARASTNEINVAEQSETVQTRIEFWKEFGRWCGVDATVVREADEVSQRQCVLELWT